jgi:hypothetical protein
MARSVKNGSPKAAHATKKSAKVTTTKAVAKDSPIDRICSALAELKAIYQGQPPRAMVALMADYDAESAGFKKALGDTKKEGLITYGKDGSLALTALGEEKTPQAEALKDNAAMLRKLEDILLKKKAPKKVHVVLELLADGNAHSIAEIAHKTDYPDQQSAGFKKFMGTFGTMKDFFVREKATLMLSDAAFPYGRP